MRAVGMQRGEAAETALSENALKLGKCLIWDLGIFANNIAITSPSSTVNLHLAQGAEAFQLH